MFKNEYFGVYRYDTERHGEYFVVGGTFEFCKRFISNLPEEQREDYEIYEDSTLTEMFEYF